MGDRGSERAATAMDWQVNGLPLAGLAWGRPGDRPVLALHGWLDNAASFARLGPLLAGCHVVAPDLTGHGQSARRSADASYQIWDDLPELLGIINDLGWDTFDLVGHSRGGIIATLLASAFPERVNHLVLLDAVAPAPVAPEHFATQMRTALEDKSRLLNRANRVFASIDDAVVSRAKHGLSSAAARLLAERSLRACPGGVTWTTDPRLQGASAVKLTDGQIKAVLGALRMPTLLLLARENPLQLPDVDDYAQGRIESLTVQVVAGGHHCHMESQAQDVARYLLSFLADANKREYA